LGELEDEQAKASAPATIAALPNTVRFASFVMAMCSPSPGF
jgi:hypothetical protein